MNDGTKRQGPAEERRLGTLRVVVLHEGDDSLDVDAVVIEDDTYSVLSADPEFHEPTEHPLRIWTAVHEAVPATPGTVSVKGGEPLKLFAVVHDLAEDPTWKEEWVSNALLEIFEHAERMQIRNLALPILGAVHGKLPVERFVLLLRQALDRSDRSTLASLWLTADAKNRSELAHLLDVGGDAESSKSAR
jgi:hypothetical protein